MTIDDNYNTDFAIQVEGERVAGPPGPAGRDGAPGTPGMPGIKGERGERGEGNRVCS